MKQSEMEIGKTYVVRVSGQLCRVRVDSYTVFSFSGKRQRWNGTNLETGRKVSGTAARLRREVS